MHWLKILFIPLNLLLVQTDGCKSKIPAVDKTINSNTQVIDKTEKQDKNTNQLYAHWVESGIDENGLVFKLRPRRGGISNLSFKSDGSVTNKGAVNCGFGRQYEGNFELTNDDKTIVAKYDKTTKYMGPDKEPEPIDVTSKYTIERLNENELILIRYDETGHETRTAYLNKTLWDTLEYGAYPVAPVR